MKRKSSWRIEWILFASAVLLFLMSRFIVPRYEEMASLLEEESHGQPWSQALFIISLVLAVLFVLRLVWRFR